MTTLILSALHAPKLWIYSIESGLMLTQKAACHPRFLPESIIIWSVTLWSKVNCITWNNSCLYLHGQVEEGCGFGYWNNNLPTEIFVHKVIISVRPRSVFLLAMLKELSDYSLEVQDHLYPVIMGLMIYKNPSEPVQLLVLWWMILKNLWKKVG